MLPTAAVAALVVAVAGVPDPRHARGTRYAAPRLLALAVWAMTCGARSRSAIAQWGWEHTSAAVRAALGIRHADMPSVATLFAALEEALIRLFRDLDRAACATALAAWLAARGGEPVPASARAGKTLRGIHGEPVPGVHLVAAVTHGRGDVRGQTGGVITTRN